MNIPPLCIIQARLNSTRLPRKMLLEIDGETLIARAFRLANEVFYAQHVIVAIPIGDADSELAEELNRLNANTYVHDGPEWDVLARYWQCATAHRWHPEAIIHRWTPDDPFKTPLAVWKVLNGERCPVELGGEAFTLQMLTRAHQRTSPDDEAMREHLGTHPMLFPAPAPPAPAGCWTIDTQTDLDAARLGLRNRITVA